MGCVSSAFLEDEDRIVGGPALGHHIVSLTSTTYGLLTTLDQPPPQTPPPPPPTATSAADSPVLHPPLPLHPSLRARGHQLLGAHGRPRPHHANQASPPPLPQAVPKPRQGELPPFSSLLRSPEEGKRPTAAQRRPAAGEVLAGDVREEMPAGRSPGGSAVHDDAARGAEDVRGLQRGAGGGGGFRGVRPRAGRVDGHGIPGGAPGADKGDRSSGAGGAEAVRERKGHRRGGGGAENPRGRRSGGAAGGATEERRRGLRRVRRGEVSAVLPVQRQPEGSGCGGGGGSGGEGRGEGWRRETRKGKGGEMR